MAGLGKGILPCGALYIPACAGLTKGVVGADTRERRSEEWGTGFPPGITHKNFKFLRGPIRGNDVGCEVRKFL